MIILISLSLSTSYSFFLPLLGSSSFFFFPDLFSLELGSLMLRRLTHLQLVVVARVPSNKDSPQKKNNIPFFLFKVFPISIQVSDRWLVP